MQVLAHSKSCAPTLSSCSAWAKRSDAACAEPAQTLPASMHTMVRCRADSSRLVLSRSMCVGLLSAHQELIDGGGLSGTKEQGTLSSMQFLGGNVRYSDQTIIFKLFELPTGHLEAAPTGPKCCGSQEHLLCMLHAGAAKAPQQAGLAVHLQEQMRPARKQHPGWLQTGARPPRPPSAQRCGQA